ncbi:MAG TPA: CBS domain-containing protein, partial [Streptosporangiaceae bacterium]
MVLMHPDEIAASIRGRHVQTPLPRLLGFPRTEAATNVRQALAERQFDSAPVLDDGQVSGYVLASDLQNDTDTIEPHIRPITIGTVITGDAPLAALMPCMVDAGFLYVVEGNKIAGIVTPHDLNKQPGHTYFYLLVTALELALAERIRGHFRDQ